MNAVPTQPERPAARITRHADSILPTRHGEFRAFAYVDETLGTDHLALVAPQGPATLQTGVVAPLVRVHSECLTGEALGSLKCECGPQLETALDLVQSHGGAVVYLRGHEGRGIGLANKISAYQLQDQGVDTLDANLQLGLPADARDYGAAAQILRDLGMTCIQLLTNNPDKVAQLVAHGIQVVERVPLVVGVGTFNDRYLRTKRDRMGHQIAL
ncbi:GTP cyclohydrolase II [Micrococcales bacterium 31B]|nr:GTP cyclohydrolase II [Micrococcales bacterium 31B]